MNADVMTVHVVDDDETVCRSLALLLRSYGYVVAIHHSGPAFLEHLGREKLPTAEPGMACVVLELRMPEMDGLAVQRAMLARGVRLPVVAMSGRADVPFAVEAMKAGAIDLIQKPYAADVMLRAINVAMAPAARIRPAVLSRMTALARLAFLTAREAEVLFGVMRGQPNKVIAHLLGISPRTVEIHRSRMMLKLECRSVAEVVHLGFQAGLSLRD